MNNKNLMMPNIGMTNPILLCQLMKQQQNLLNKQLNNNINNKPQLNDLNQINNINLTNNLINANNNPNNPIQPNINMSFPFNGPIPYFPGFNIQQQQSRNNPLKMHFPNLKIRISKICKDFKLYITKEK